MAREIHWHFVAKEEKGRGKKLSLHLSGSTTLYYAYTAHPTCVGSAAKGHLTPKWKGQSTHTDERECGQSDTLKMYKKEFVQKEVLIVVSQYI